MARSSTPADSEVRDVTLPSGIRIIAKQDASSNLVAIHVFVSAGAADETIANAGIGTFVASSLFSGTNQQSAEKITHLINELGNNVGATWDPDFTQIHALMLKERFPDAAYLLSDVLKNASFPDKEVEKNRKLLIEGFQERSSDLFGIAYDQMHLELFKNTPRARPVNGDRSVIESLQPSALRAFYAKVFIPENIVVSVVGALPTDKVVETLREDLASFPRSNPRHRTLPVGDGPRILRGQEEVSKTINELNAPYVLIGYLAPGAGSGDYPAMLLANALLGGMKTSKLFTTVREQKGLAYEVASLYNPQVAWGDVSVYMILTPPAQRDKLDDTIGQGKSTLLAAVKDFSESSPTDADLKRAKQYLIGAYLIARERLPKRAYFLGYSEIAQKEIGGYQFDRDYPDKINAVTVADVKRAAKLYFGAGSIVSTLKPGDPNEGVITK
jgi:predicted Zn-dependent peptidase